MFLLKQNAVKLRSSEDAAQILFREKEERKPLGIFEMSEEQEEFLIVISDVMPKKSRTVIDCHRGDRERKSHEIEMSRKLYTADLDYCSLMSTFSASLPPSHMSFPVLNFAITTMFKNFLSR